MSRSGYYEWRGRGPSQPRRSRVEGWFGNLKSNNTEGLTRGAFRVMGIAKTGLMLGIYAAAAHLRLLAGWKNRQTTTAAPTPPAQSPGFLGRAGRRVSADRDTRAGPTTT